MCNEVPSRVYRRTQLYSHKQPRVIYALPASRARQPSSRAGLQMGSTPSRAIGQDRPNSGKAKWSNERAAGLLPSALYQSGAGASACNCECYMHCQTGDANMQK